MKKLKSIIFLILLLNSKHIIAQIVVTTGSPTLNYNGTNITRPAHIFTWKDALNNTRSAVMIDQTSTYCGYLARFTYNVAGTPRVCQGTGSNGAETYGDGFIQNHSANGGDDESTNRGGTNTLPLLGAHHAIIQYSLPTYSITDPINGSGTVPSSIQWFFATGRDYPIYSITQDARALPGNLGADCRSPYGDMHYDGSNPINGAWGGDYIGGISMGDTKKFVSVVNNTTNESTLLTTNSGWKYTQDNTIPYAMEWTKTVNAEQGHVQTLPISIKDAGRTDLSAIPISPGQQRLAGPFITDDQYPYQISAYGILSPTGGVTKRLTWGTNFGAIGGFNDWWMGAGNYKDFTKHFDGTRTTGNAGMFLAYSVFDVFGTHTGGYTAGAVGKMVTQMENMQLATLSASVGTVVTTGPAGIKGSGVAFASVPTINYTPAGYNPIYATWEANAVANVSDITLTPATGKPIDHPIFVINNYTATSISTITINNNNAIANTDYFATFDATANKLWITLNSNISIATNVKINVITPLALPTIELNGFNKANKNNLEWQSINNQSIKLFELEKSNNGIDFISIFSTFKNNTTKYSFIDENISNINYYRIKQIDNDDNFSFSNTISIYQNDNDNRIRVSPNPARDNIIFNGLLKNKNYPITIYDVFGKIVFEKIINNAQNSIYLNNLIQGVYIIKIMNNNEKKMIRFIKE